MPAARCSPVLLRHHSKGSRYACMLGAVHTLQLQLSGAAHRHTCLQDCLCAQQADPAGLSSSMDARLQASRILSPSAGWLS